jgi:uncharacterized protein YyaL (SSP411 family)
MLSHILFLFYVPLLLVLIIPQRVMASSPSGTATGGANTIESFIRRKLAAGEKPNRLINEKSPYLLQHAFNPVNWYPWGEEAFAIARLQNKLVFLSIGYSTCHWCHVMARESFENQAIADILNRYFICIKVDREERPDIDQIYMTFTNALTGSGGWPLSVFLTPDRKPVYAGTYFPPEAKYGRPGFADMLNSLQKMWTDDQAGVMENGDRIVSQLEEQLLVRQEAVELSSRTLANGYRELEESYDETDGGFGRAPKFPRPSTLNFLLRYYHRTKEPDALQMVLHTLEKMSEGGIHDHIGGGFHRYSVDSQWHVPHFEKMLYDQAQLAVSYLEAYQLSRAPIYEESARDILDFVLNEMTDPTGGFYSALDADSAEPGKPDSHREGAFYVWTAQEIAALLPPETVPIFNYYYGVEEKGNVSVDPHDEFTNRNILHISHSLRQTADTFNRKVDTVKRILAEARQVLDKERNSRPRPHLDDKIITSWNGLMIGAYARGFQVLNDERYLHAAEKAAAFIQTTLYDSETNTLLRRYRDKTAGLRAQLTDYVFLAHGLLDLYEASFDSRWLEFAIQLTDKQVELFADKNGAGFYDTAGKETGLLLRIKDEYDGAEPSGNSIAVLNLLRLGQATDNDSWKNLARTTFEAFSKTMQEQPGSMPQMMAAFDFQLQKPKQIVIAGNPDSEDTKAMQKQIFSRFAPNKVVLVNDGGKGLEILSEYLPLISAMKMIGNRATAYVCLDYSCKKLTTDPEELREILRQ